LTASTIVTGEDGANKPDTPCTAMPTRAVQGSFVRGRTEAGRRIGRHVYGAPRCPRLSRGSHRRLSQGDGPPARRLVMVK
jgi:hypothetical protein